MGAQEAEQDIHRRETERDLRRDWAWGRVGAAAAAKQMNVGSGIGPSIHLALDTGMVPAPGEVV
jgi:hypothetical protein